MKDTHRPWVLGLASSLHNGAACLLHGDEIVVAIQEERLLRAKRADLRAGQESLAVRYCLDYAGIGAADLTAVGVCAVGTESSHDAHLSPQICPTQNDIRVMPLSHHLGHAIGAFATSGFTSSAIAVIDGIGSPATQLTDDEWASVVCAQRDRHDRGDATVCEVMSLYSASGTTIKAIEKHVARRTPKRPGQMRKFFSVGSLFLNVGAQIFGESLDGAGKVMGLAPYGQPTMPTSHFFHIDGDELIFSDTVAGRFLHGDRWPQRRDEYQNLAASVQVALEDAVLWLIGRARGRSAEPRLCYAGGVALNSVANQRIIEQGAFDDVFIMPAAEDSGTAIGAAYHALWQLAHPHRVRRHLNDRHGRVYTSNDIDEALTRHCNVHAHRSGSLADEVAAELADGKIVGWFQGGAELGPRSLGQRSILADARLPDIKNVLNDRVKFRESFRPYAPAILEEHVADWFENAAGTCSPFMLRVMRFREHQRERVPGVVHVDGTGRVQTVTSDTNPELHALLSAFNATTGVPILLNTSFNTAGEPIVDSPDDALLCFAFSDLDLCVMGDYVVRKVREAGSPLDWYPVLSCDWLSEYYAVTPRRSDWQFGTAPGLFMSACSGRRADDGGDARGRIVPFDHLRVVVTGRWGSVTHVLGGEWRPWLRLLDGTLTGAQVLEALRTGGDTITATTFQLRLARLARAGIVTFKRALVPKFATHANRESPEAIINL